MKREAQQIVNKWLCQALDRNDSKLTREACIVLKALKKEDIGDENWNAGINLLTKDGNYTQEEAESYIKNLGEGLYDDDFFNPIKPSDKTPVGKVYTNPEVSFNEVHVLQDEDLSGSDRTDPNVKSEFEESGTLDVNDALDVNDEDYLSDIDRVINTQEVTTEFGRN